MRSTTLPFAALAVIALATLTSAQSTDSDPVGPLTTNNAQSACVQYGGCTSLAAGASVVTETQKGPVTPPASSVRTAAPTDSAGSAASISALASQGAGAAYSSLQANGQAGSIPGDVSLSLTGTVNAISSSSTGSATSGSSGSNAAPQSVEIRHWAPISAALLAVVAGAVML